MAPTDDPSTGHLNRRAREVRLYSQVVRWMKVLLPIAAILLVGLIFLTGRDREPIADLENASTIAALATGMRLENPRFTGITDDGEPFVVTAVSALPDGMNADRVALDQPNGEIRLGGDRLLNVSAHEGEIFRKSERLALNGSVVLTTSDGYTARTERVELDLDSKTATAPSPIAAEGPTGALSSDSFEVLNPTGDRNSLILRFEGNVRLTYRPRS